MAIPLLYNVLSKISSAWNINNNNSSSSSINNSNNSSSIGGNSSLGNSANLGGMGSAAVRRLKALSSCHRRIGYVKHTVL